MSFSRVSIYTVIYITVFGTFSLSLHFDCQSVVNKICFYTVNMAKLVLLAVEWNIVSSAKSASLMLRAVGKSFT